MRQTVQIPLSDVRPDPGQPRKSKPVGYIQELSGVIRNLRHNGSNIAPIEVRPDPENAGKYIILKGECRYLAHITDDRLKGEGWIEAFVVETKRESKDIFMDQISENVNRLDMGIVETIQSYGRAIELGATVEELAETLGKPVHILYSDLTILKLPELVQKAIENKSLPVSVAKEIANEPNDARMMKAFTKVMTAKSAKDMMRKLQAWRDQDSQKTLDQVFATVDVPPDELKAAGKKFDKLAKAFELYARESKDKGGLVVKARSGKVRYIENLAAEMVKQGNILLENAKLYREYTASGRKEEKAA